MYAGRVVEAGLVKDIYSSPSHPYTVKLLNALPTSKQKRLEAIRGMVPDLIEPPWDADLQIDVILLKKSVLHASK